MSELRLIAVAAVMLGALGAPALAEQPSLTVNTLIDRAQIEDLRVDYYSHLGAAGGDFGNFYVADGILDVNGLVVTGDAATADVIWTGVNSASVKALPQILEQGREHDELVKRDGRWYFKHRVITTDGGLPAMFEKTYQSR